MSINCPTRQLIIVCVLLYTFFAAFPGQPAFGQAPPTPLIITLSDTDPSPVNGEKKLRPIAAYLASKLDDTGVRGVSVVIHGNLASLSSGLREGTVDCVLSTLYPTLMYRRTNDLQPLLLGRLKGLESERSLIFTRNDGGVEDLADLKGKTVAFADRTSTSSYFIPSLALTAAGLDLIELESAGHPLSPESVGYVFAGDSLNVSAWVFYGKVDAGVVSSIEWDSQEIVPEAYRRELSVIHRSREFPALLFSVRSGLSPALVERLGKELAGMTSSEEGSRALQSCGASDFVLIPEGMLTAFEGLLDTFSAHGLD